MIRESTLTAYKQWSRPTPDEVKEIIRILNFTESELSIILGVHKGTIARWKSGVVNIPFVEWASLCYLAGIGDIWATEDSIKDLQIKVKRSKSYYLKYSKKLHQKEMQLQLEN